MIAIFGRSTLKMVDQLLCPKNCSGNGDCLGGTCLCQVKYSGWTCGDANIGYYITFGVLFCAIALTTIAQLMVRVYLQITKSPAPGLYTALKPDIQKLLYICVICATGSRAFYFLLGVYDLDFVPALIKDNLFTIFYPFVLSGFSLLICFWAESFHLAGLQLDKPRFLTKSIFGFIVFNVVVYSMYVGQIISNNCLSASLREQMNAIFNSCFAFLMFFVLVFFLIYGVEIFCKVKGAFKQNPVEGSDVNHGQLYQSRMGLCVQACFQLTVMFLMSEVIGEMWMENMSVGDKNIVDIAFHFAELACILWFPCTLWNVKTPSRLWILNPQNLLSQHSVHEDMRIVTEAPNNIADSTSEETHGAQVVEEAGKFITGKSDCWICYDRDRDEALIQPCNCKGDMKLVHHNCLKEWLVEKSAGHPTDNRSLACDVCKDNYKVISDGRTFWTPNKVQFRAWAQTFMVIMTMASLPVVLFSVWHEIHQAVAKTALVIFLFLGEYCLLRLLGFNFVKAYNITRTRALRILGHADPVGVTDMGNSSQPNMNAVCNNAQPPDENVTSIRL